jgi:hypothetical protein
MQLDYNKLIERYPWIIERGQDCILSPDSDGLLCGLLMSHYLGWKIRGFYDGKILLVQKGIKPRECVFLDMEIYRKGIKSVGQHMVMYDKEDLPSGWSAFGGSISANNLREYDFKNDFKSKYPFGTIHLLVAIVGQRHQIKIQKSAVSPLLYTDGTFKNQFNYPENCLGWLDFLGARKEGNPLQNIFMDPHYSTYELMIELQRLFSGIHQIGGGRRGGDKIKISDSKGQLANVDTKNGKLATKTIAQAENLLKMLAIKTSWSFDRAAWSWGPYSVLRFRKGSEKPGKARYANLLAKDPISLAIISRNSIEYTLDPRGVL